MQHKSLLKSIIYYSDTTKLLKSYSNDTHDTIIFQYNDLKEELQEITKKIINNKDVQQNYEKITQELLNDKNIKLKNMGKQFIKNNDEIKNATKYLNEIVNENIIVFGTIDFIVFKYYDKTLFILHNGNCNNNNGNNYDVSILVQFDKHKYINNYEILKNINDKKNNASKIMFYVVLFMGIFTMYRIVKKYI